MAIPDLRALRGAVRPALLLRRPSVLLHVLAVPRGRVPLHGLRCGLAGSLDHSPGHCGSVPSGRPPVQGHVRTRASQPHRCITSHRLSGCGVLRRRPARGVLQGIIHLAMHPRRSDGAVSVAATSTGASTVSAICASATSNASSVPTTTRATIPPAAPTTTSQHAATATCPTVSARATTFPTQPADQPSPPCVSTLSTTTTLATTTTTCSSGLSATIHSSTASATPWGGQVLGQAGHRAHRRLCAVCGHMARTWVLPARLQDGLRHAKALVSRR